MSTSDQTDAEFYAQLPDWEVWVIAPDGTREQVRTYPRVTSIAVMKHELRAHYAGLVANGSYASIQVEGKEFYAVDL
jgi:hypothetical protein